MEEMSARTKLFSSPTFYQEYLLHLLAASIFLWSYQISNSKILKFSTWQQVLQRGNPFSVKGGLREQRQSKFCSKRHHGHVKKISPGSSGHSRPTATAQVFLNFNEREYNHTLLSPPFSRPNLPKREQEPHQQDPPPPAPDPPPLVLSCRSHSQNPFKHGGRL